MTDNQSESGRLPWYEDEQFWKVFAPYLFDDYHWDIADLEAKQSAALLRLTVPAAVLDTCCGVGRHSLALAGQGYTVTGVDRTSAYIEAAKGSASAHNYPIEFVQTDMRSFSRPAAFDGAINLFTSFGYFEDEKDELVFLGNIRDSLKPGAGLVIDLLGKEVLARTFRERDWHEEDGAMILQERRILGSWSKIENRWIVIKDGEKNEYVFSHRLYSADELIQLVLKAGFGRAEAFGSLTGVPYNHTSERLVVTAWK
ncbi:MAG: class I SAM-dependent methyltransferase [Spirochaetales bacterium]|nr:MAG: class I SAM-dependent methyltransferase [Spirochaetales bacterium]